MQSHRDTRKVQIAADVAELAIVEILHRNKTSMGGGNTDTDEDTDLGALP